MSVAILYLRSLPLERDSRSTKMVAEYRSRGHRVTPLVWSRGAEPSKDVDTVTCTAKGAYGQRLRGFGARLAWMWFLTRYMIGKRQEYDVVHLVDLDTAIVAAPLARLFRKPVIYDAFDHIGAIAGEGPLGKFLSLIERLALGLATIKVFPDLIRLKQYGVAFDEAVRILGNLPDMSGTSNVPAATAAQNFSMTLKIVYIGTLEALHRGLEYLPKLCELLDGKIEVVVGGNGELHEFFEDAAGRVSNLVYIGYQDYPAALEQMALSDCLYGPYLLSAPAHRFASPNKMYEHLALGKPLITNTGTPPGDLVQNLQSGFLFDGTLCGLETLIAKLDRQQCQAAGKRALSSWVTEFAGLRERQLNEFFVRFDQLTGS